MTANFALLPPAFKFLAEPARKAVAQIMGDPCATFQYPSSSHLSPRSEHLEPRSEHFPVMDFTEDPTLLQIADPVRSNKHCSPEMTQQTIRNLCQGRFLTLNQLAALLNRSSDGLRQRFIKPMVDDEKVLERRFPQQPNHEQQAYRTHEP